MNQLTVMMIAIYPEIKKQEKIHNELIFHYLEIIFYIFAIYY